MWTYYPDLLSSPVPRYTSFPTAAEFTSDVGAADMEDALGSVTGDLSVYVHIPYCKEICWYCGCNTGAANRRDRLTNYLDALHREAAMVGERLGRAVEVRRISFGGGTPNAIAPVDFVRIAQTLTICLPLEAPLWSIELDPRSLTREWGMVIAGVGVRNASLGVQTFSPRLQAAIGRIQPDETIERAVALLREASVTSLNFDLMYGLPGQTMEDLHATLKRACALGADRIALFGYAHVPHLIPRQGRIDASALPDQQQRFKMAAYGYEFLTGAGYCPVGFDHFALPGDPLALAAAQGRVHRNFQGFTDDDAPALLGLGASAISSFPDVLVQNEKNTGRYCGLVSRGMLPAARGVRRDAEDRNRAMLIEELLCNGTVHADAALRRSLTSAIQPFRERGLVAEEPDLLRVLPDGLPYTRTIAALLDPYRNMGSKRLSSAV